MSKTLKNQSAKRIRNWTIMPIIGVSPDEVCGGLTATFPRLMGNVMSYRRIHNPAERAKKGECCQQMSADIMTSEIMEVHNRLDDSVGVSVTTRSGTVYRLEGDPRPSFNKHCKAMDVNWRGSDAVDQLVERLRRN